MICVHEPEGVTDISVKSCLHMLHMLCNTPCRHVKNQVIVAN